MRARCVRGLRECVGPGHTSEPAPFRLSFPPTRPRPCPSPIACVRASGLLGGEVQQGSIEAAAAAAAQRRSGGAAAAAVAAAAAAAAAAAQMKVRLRWLAKEERGVKGCRRARATHAQHANAHATRTRVHVHRTRTCATRTHSTRARTPHTTARTHTYMPEGAAAAAMEGQRGPRRRGKARRERRRRQSRDQEQGVGKGARVRGAKGRGRRATGDGERNATERVTVGEEHKAMSADMGGR
jgi:hypothetical protein